MTFDPAWEATHHAREWGRWPLSHFVRYAMTEFPTREDRQGARALEIGCGAGAQVAFLAEEGFQVTGIDASQSAIVRASTLLARRGLADGRAQLRVADATNLPFKHDSFELVVDIACVQCLDDYDAQRAVMEMARVCRRGGVLFAYHSAYGTDPAVHRGARARNLKRNQVRELYGAHFDITVLADGYGRPCTNPVELPPAVLHWIVLGCAR